MALIIKAYNPSRCGDCDLCELYTDMMTEESCYKCVVTTNVVDTEKKHYTCPIIGEIPDKHGDLIDEDEFRQVFYEEMRKHRGNEPIITLIKELLAKADNAPVVVEATE